MKSLFFLALLFSAYGFFQVAGSGVPVLGSTQGAGGGLGGGTCGTATNYAYSNSITIPAQSGMSADLSTTNFDLYLTGSTKWATVANGGFMQKSDGSDLIFCTAASGSGGTQLYHELEANSYVTTTGAGIWHVALGSAGISKTVTTTIYYYIGASGAVNWNNPFHVPGSVNSGVFIAGETVTDTAGHASLLISTSPFDIGSSGTNFTSGGSTWTGGTSGATYTQSAIPASLVWANYVLVNHMGTASSLSILDSTNIYSGANVNTATATAGQIGGAVAVLQASTQHLTDVIPGSNTNPLFPSPTLISVTAWVNATSFPNATYNSVMSNENGISSGFNLTVRTNGKLAIYFNGGANYDNTGTNTLSTGTTYMLGASYNDSTFVLNGYFNGTLDHTVTGSNVYNETNATVQTGGSPFAGRNWNGWIDELRICGCFISTDQRLAEYNNQKPVGTFYTIN